MLEKIHHSELPDGILLCFKTFEQPPSGDVDEIESHRGKHLIKEMAHIWFHQPDPEILAPKNEKPAVFINGLELSVSFSHTREAIGAAISRDQIVGCDMELTNRVVSRLLVERIQHPQEDEDLYAEFSPIQIWTLKEAGLKMIGTGLRKPMNGVRITKKTNHLFDVEFHDGKRAEICSFHYKEHWISVCFQ